MAVMSNIEDFEDSCNFENSFFQGRLGITYNTTTFKDGLTSSECFENFYVSIVDWNKI